MITLTQYLINIFLIFICSLTFAGERINNFTHKPDYCLTFQEADGSPANTNCKPIIVGNGTLVANGTGYTFTPTSGSSFSDSAGLAAILSDETGTGLAVFNNSPTITTPILTLPDANGSLPTTLGQPKFDYTSHLLYVGTGSTSVKYVPERNSSNGGFCAYSSDGGGRIDCNQAIAFPPTVTPGGSIYDVQINDGSGSFYGEDGLTYVPGTDILTVGENGTAGILTLMYSNTDTLTLKSAALSTNRTITFPDVTGNAVTTGDIGTVTSAMIANSSIVNADVNSSAAIDYSKLAALTSAHILVGSAGNVATDTAMSGDVAISNTGATTVQANSVALATDTTGDYVTSVGTSILTGLTGGAPGSENAALSLAWDYSSTLASNPAMTASKFIPSTTGILFEGSSADNNELLLTPANPTTDITITIPAVTGTLLNDATLQDSGRLAAVIGDETGSGSLVFGTSPSLVTPTMSLPTVTGTLSGFSVSIDGEAARTIGMMRRTTSDSIGQSYTVSSGGATVGGINRGAGALILKTGNATGNGGSSISFQTVTNNQGSGTTDRAVSTKLQIDSAGHLVSGGNTPVLSDCGDGATISGNDIAGHITTGTTTSGICTITFDKAYTDFHKCFFTGYATSGTFDVYTSSTTYVSVEGAIADNITFDYFCIQ